jgi:hypothetical protein
MPPSDELPGEHTIDDELPDLVTVQVLGSARALVEPAKVGTADTRVAASINPCAAISRRGEIVITHAPNIAAPHLLQRNAVDAGSNSQPSGLNGRVLESHAANKATGPALMTS